MSESDHPEEGAASSKSLTADEGDAALDAILNPPEQDQGKDEAQKTDEKPEEEAKAEAEGDDSGDEPEDDAESEAESETEEKEDEGEYLELTDELEIELGEGKRATLADLKADFGKVQQRRDEVQRDYTEKTMALGERTRELESQEKRVLEHAQQLKQQREDIHALANRLIGEPPATPDVDAADDPVAWSVYAQQKAQFDKKLLDLQKIGSELEQERQKSSKELQEEREKTATTEWNKLVEIRPELSDEKVLRKVNSDITNILPEKYGFTVEELGTITDHRFRLAMLDLLEFHKDKANVGKAKEKVADKPKMLRSGKTQTASEKSAKASKAIKDKVRRGNASIKDEIDLLLDFDDKYGGL